MSGTSLDGLDIAHCTFTFNGTWQYLINQAVTVPYNQTLIDTLKQAHQLPAMALQQLDSKLAHLFAKEVITFLKKWPLEVDFISSHGHTVFHQPKNAGFSTPFTTQIGNGGILAAVTGYNVVCDFRTADVSLGGQGAPLVPMGDLHLFNNYDMCLNIGGIINFSCMHAKPCLASDVCFANMALNYLAHKNNKAFDENGQMAADGVFNDQLFNQLQSLPFWQQPFPKSLGKEYFDHFVLPLIETENISVNDKLHTFCHHIADTVSSLQPLLPAKHQVLVTGGGAYNHFLMQCLQAKGFNLIIPDKQIVEFKEALIFAFLGVLRFRNEYNTLKDVTGAMRNTSSGAMYLGQI